MSSTNKPESTATVEEIVTAFKRRGHFDAIRKSTFAFFDSDNAENLVSKLRDIVRAEVEKDTNLLKKDRSKSSILVGGAVDRAGVVETIKQDRNSIFEDQQVHDKVKEIVVALVQELKQTETKAEE